MKRLIAATILLAIANIAAAQGQFCLTDGTNVLRGPQSIPRYMRGRPQPYYNLPASEWHADGWRPYMGLQSAPYGQTALRPHTLTLIGDEVWSVPRFVDTAEYEAEQEAEAAAQLAAEQAAIPIIAADQLTLLAPVLTDHPASNAIPTGGMYYRIAGSNELITLWFVRDPDHIATQLSAHDDTGVPISKSRNLNTGEEEVINLRKLKEDVEKIKEKQKP